MVRPSTLLRRSFSDRVTPTRLTGGVSAPSSMRCSAVSHLTTVGINQKCSVILSRSRLLLRRIFLSKLSLFSSFFSSAIPASVLVASKKSQFSMIQLSCRMRKMMLMTFGATHSSTALTGKHLRRDLIGPHTCPRSQMTWIYSV